MFTIGLIDNVSLKSFDDESFKHALDNNLSILETDMNNLMIDTAKYLNLNKEQLADTEICNETNTHIFQMAHIPPTIDKKPDENMFNSLGSMLMTEPVYGRCVVFKSKLMDDFTCSPDSISINELKELLYSTRKHKAVIIDTDGYIEEKNFGLDLTKILKSTHAPIEFSIFGYNLIMYVNINYENKPINKLASRLSGKFFVLDDVIIVNKFKNSFGDITKEEIKRLDPLSWIHDKDRKIEQGNKNINGKKVVFNRFVSVKKAKKKYKITDELKNWDNFFKSINQNKPINDYALKKSLKGESTA